MLTFLAGLPLLASGLASGQSVPPIWDSSYGYLLPGNSNCTVWWCEATYKVGCDRSAPTQASPAVRISAARNEYEPFQLVLSPAVDLPRVTVSVSNLVRQGGHSNVIAATNVEICRVEYVPVQTPSETSGTCGLYPDPLPLLTGPFRAPAGSNQPLWLTVYVPKDAPAGEYLGTVTIQAPGSIEVPLRLRVHDFALPDTTHTRTAYYVDVSLYTNWHRLTTPSQKRQVWDLYMQVYRKHRLAPYAAHLYSPINWTRSGEQLAIDYAEFDEAMARYLDEFGFNAFNLMGHKSLPLPASLGGHLQFSPQYCEQLAQLMEPVLAHLREKGWAEKAYCYWKDEPSDTNLHASVISGMDALDKCAPGLRRLLTVNFDPPSTFDGRVDIWASLFNSSCLPRIPARQSAGEESWWYVCNGPAAPYPNNFIDHPALNHRIRFWMAEKYGITGDLYWAAGCWRRNPWTTTIQFSPPPRNGDGVLLYPPTRTWPEGPQLVGPVTTLRLELIREGLEDYEYFWLLKQQLQRALRRGPDSPVVVEGNAALAAALALVPSLTVFEPDPQALYAARERVAEAIEALDDKAPFIVSQPVSRAVVSGGSTTLRVDAVGWPVPACQWQLNGSAVAGATQAVLLLTNVGPLQTGAYAVALSNSAGAVTSAVAQVEGYWSEQPRIVYQPSGLVRSAGSRAVFAVAAVSSNAVTHCWLFNGAPLAGGVETNPTLTLTNLSVAQAGDYSVVISNVAGVVSSAAARLVVLPASTNREPSPTGHDSEGEGDVVGGGTMPDAALFAAANHLEPTPPRSTAVPSVTNALAVAAPEHNEPSAPGRDRAGIDTSPAGSPVVAPAGATGGSASPSNSIVVPPIVDSSYGYLLPGNSNCTVWWCEATYKVGRDRAAPAHPSAAVQIAAARNEYEPFQIVLRPAADLRNASVSVSDFVQPGGSHIIPATNVEICLAAYVPVADPSDASCVSGLYPDPLAPVTGTFDAGAGSNQPLWITVYVPKDAPAGEYAATVKIQAGSPIVVPVRLRVFDFALPDTRHTEAIYYVDVNDPTWHNFPSKDRASVWDLYLQNYRRHRVNPYSPHLYSPIKWSLTGGKFTIDFKEFDEAMSRYLDEFGFSRFNLMGHKSPDLPAKLGGYRQFTPEYRRLFARLMGPIMAHLREKGWAEKAFCYWIDEPANDESMAIMAGGMDALDECAPGLARVLTIGYYNPQYGSQYDAGLNGRVDIWVPGLKCALLPRFLDRQLSGEEVWWYVACFPPAPWPNNFLDHPALYHRIRPWIAEKYGITGELYWAANYWAGKNPWRHSKSMEKLPNGDGFLLYPPAQKPPGKPLLAAPFNSLRWEIIREGLEDAEYFWLLKQRLQRSAMRLDAGHPALVEGAAARRSALALIESDTAFAKDPLALYAARRRLAAAIEALEDGAPVLVCQPASRAVSAGGSTRLRAEALGWPPPLYQWKLNGNDLPGATNALLALANLQPRQTGAYTVVARNSAGAATSAVARVEGYWSDSPRIVSQPESLVRRLGSRAIFSVAAVSANRMTYAWHFNGAPLDGGSATNTTLVLNDLSPSRAGDYHVVIRNVSGAVTSATAQLVVLPASPNVTLVSTGALWRYQDAGADPGAAWRLPGYDDSAWSQGPAPLGYGSGEAATIVGGGSAPGTVYFRRTFAFSDPLPLEVMAHLQRDDGAVVYLNGWEIFRDNLPAGTVTHATPALAPMDGPEETVIRPFAVPPQLLQPGTNVLAAEVHRHLRESAPPLLPAARWSFDEMDASWRDHAGTNAFIRMGSHVVAADGKVGGCASNSGSTTAFLVAPQAPELSCSGPFTVGGWFAWGASSGEAICLQKEGEFKLSYSGTIINRYRFEVNGSVVQDQTAGTKAGQWRFVVGWFDGTKACIQVDNGPVYSAPASAPAKSAAPLIALKKADEGGGFAADEVFLYKHVLPPGDRAALFQNRPAPDSLDLRFSLTLTGTVARWPTLGPPANRRAE